MAAYGAVASLLQILEDVSLPRHLSPQIESLRDKVSFLQYALQNCNHEMFGESLEVKIRDAVFKGEDLIESKITNDFVHELEPDRHVLFDSLPEAEDEGLRGIIQEIGYIVNEVKKIKDGHAAKVERYVRNLRSAASSSSGSKFFTGSGKKVVSRFEKDVEDTRNRLFNNSLKLEIVPIVGMGGIGKTTLARRVYDDSSVDCHFDIRAWTTVSQEYNLRKVLVGLLDSGNILSIEKMEGIEEENLALNLYQSLKGRRYLIVMDDVWDDDIWDAVQRYFPNDNNGSRVLLTTRLSKVAQHANPHSPFCRMSVLNKNDSWNLLCNVIFGEDDCPLELESIGKEIAGNCKGLALAIVVTGGFLSKVSRTEEDWTSVADSFSSVVGKDDGECMEILFLSYKHLPHHLRSCFLYMSMFPEDCKIPIPKLFHLWAAEGFLKHVGKSEGPEVLAEECLEELIERNLILACEWNFRGKIETCKIHDMLWNFCIQRARKEKFLQAVKCPNDLVQEDTGAPRRFSIHLGQRGDQPEILSHIMIRASSVHSLICPAGSQTIHLPRIYLGHHMLLRVLDLAVVQLIHFPVIITQLVNLRYLAIICNDALPSSIYRLRNLEILIHFINRTPGNCSFLPVEIWLMPKLRHIILAQGCLIDPLDTQMDMDGILLLQNLQTLFGVRNLCCGKDILRRMPNLKELGIAYDCRPSKVWSEYQLEALASLQQLEILTLFMDNSNRASRTPFQLPAGLAFPRTLKSLRLTGCEIPWESMTIVGSLPHLEALSLNNNACQGVEWEPNADEFGQLKYLQLQRIGDLVQWTADETHFPRLQQLVISSCFSLQEIPSAIGNIPTLERIKLADCHPLAVASARRIRKEQEEMANNDLKVIIINNHQKSTKKLKVKQLR